MQIFPRPFFLIFGAHAPPSNAASILTGARLWGALVHTCRPNAHTCSYVYPYPTGGQLPAAQNTLPPQHVASIYTTTYSSAAAAGALTFSGATPCAVLCIFWYSQR